MEHIPGAALSVINTPGGLMSEPGTEPGPRQGLLPTFNTPPWSSWEDTQVNHHHHWICAQGALRQGMEGVVTGRVGAGGGIPAEAGRQRPGEEAVVSISGKLGMSVGVGAWEHGS